MHPRTHMYMYIYIYTNLLSTSIHGYQEKEKKSQNLEITISRITAWGKRKKNLWGKKNKEKVHFVTPFEKNQRYAVRWSVLDTLRSRFRRNCSRIVPTRDLIYIYIYIYIVKRKKQIKLPNSQLCFTKHPPPILKKSTKRIHKLLKSRNENNAAWKCKVAL